MCGIAGIVRFDGAPIQRNRLGAMLAHLQHRGPDGELIHAHQRCVLGQTRLSIIDLLHGSQSMHAPITREHGALTVVFNGEIYNHRDLRKKLEAKGHRFASDHCDTEVLLHGYRQWKTDLPRHLNGMFAFVIWDHATNQLFLCRDRTGQKPLYLYWDPDEKQMLFASLVSALAVATGKSSLEVEPSALQNYLRWGYSHKASLIEGIEELPAAHWMLIDAQGQAKTEAYWQPPPFSKSHSKSGAVDAVETVLTESVKRCIEADVPLGCWLSGGIDSALIAALAQRQLLDRGEGPLHTYSVKLPGVGYESTRALEVARAIGTHHTELHAESGTNLIDDLRTLIEVSGEPIADISILPTFWICRAVRQRAQVALSGDGGDELFGGYERYRAMRMLSRHSWWLGKMPAAVLARRSNLEIDSAKRRLRRVIEAADSGQPERQYHWIMHLFTDKQIQDLGLSPDGQPSAANIVEPAVPNWPEESDPVHAAMRWDLTHYLPFDLLRKIDRASMAVALEVRCPMLDMQVCDLAAHLPPDVLMPHNQPKGLLRQFAARILPKKIVNWPKQNFTAPVGRWFRRNLKEPLAEQILGGQLDRLGIRHDAVKRLYDEHITQQEDHSHRLFALLSLSLWTQWLQDRPAATVFNP